MDSIITTVSHYFSEIPYASVAKVAVLLLGGLPLSYFLSTIVGKILKKGTSQHLAIFAQKMTLYVLIVLLLVTLLIELGFNLSAVLGAAGIASVAIGFAAQTSLSNIISGLFLYWERPFQVDDIIKIGDKMGFVLSIDLMSVKIRSFDNQFIRIPNESIIKSETINITRFPIRRLTINVGVSYKEDADHVIEVLKSVANNNPFCLDEPEPLIIFDSFGDSSLNFIFGPWVEKTQFLDLKNSIMRDIKMGFDEAGIEIPFPQRTIHYADPVIAHPKVEKELKPHDINS